MANAMKKMFTFHRLLVAGSRENCIAMADATTIRTDTCRIALLLNHLQIKRAVGFIVSSV